MPRKPPAADLLRWGGYAAALALAAGALTVRKSVALVSDDAWISFRYAWNLVQGHGLTWNEHLPPVEGYSNLLWTLLMVPGVALGVPIDGWSQAWGFALTLGCVVASAACVRGVGGGHPAAIAAAALTGASALLGYWAHVGLETPLLAFLLTAGTAGAVAEDRAIRAGAGRPRPWSALFFGLAVITHPEGPLYLAIPLAIRAARLRVDPIRREEWVAALLLVAPGAGQLALRLGYYGDILPNTYHAKLGGQVRPLASGVRYWLAGVVYDPWQAALWIGGGLLAAWAGRGGLLGVAAACLVFLCVTRGDTFAGLRFFAPAVPTLVAAGFAGLDALAARGPLLRGIAGVAGAVLLAMAVPTELRVHMAHEAGGGELPGGKVRLGPPYAQVQPLLDISRLVGAGQPPAQPVDWYISYLMETVPRDESFVFADVGLVGYALPGNDLIDLRGLNLRESAGLPTVLQAAGSDALSSPKAQAFLDVLHGARPAVVFLQCHGSALFGPMEALFAADATFRSGWTFAAQGPYFGGLGYTCVFVRNDAALPPRELVERRYRRMARVAPGAGDWQGRLDALAAGAPHPGRLYAPRVELTLPPVGVFAISDAPPMGSL